MDRSKETAFISAMFDEQKYADVMPREQFDCMLSRVIELDDAYMKLAGVEDGAVYDDDAAFDYMFAELTKAFAEYKMYTMRFVEDYMEYAERYLDSIGAIDWE